MTPMNTAGGWETSGCVLDLSALYARAKSLKTKLPKKNKKEKELGVVSLSLKGWWLL